MSYKGTNSVNPGPGTSAEGQIDIKGEAIPTQGPALVYPQPFSVESEASFGPEPSDFARDAAISNPDPPHGYDLDMGLQPNKFPRQGGSDTLSGDEVIFS